MHLARLTIALVAGAAATAGYSNYTAQDDTIPAAGSPVPGIHVFGTGEVAAKPDSILIRTRLEASAEVGADVIVKYQDARRRAIKEITDLKIPGLAVSGPGPSVEVVPGVDENSRNMVIFNGRRAATPEPQVRFYELLSITIPGVQDFESSSKQIATVLDKAKEVGLKTASTSVDPNMAYYYLMYQQRMPQASREWTGVRYVVSDRAALEEAALKKAMEDAAARAARIAKAASRTLGQVTSVSMIPEETATEKLSIDMKLSVRVSVVYELK
ncbi:MAG: SIMPL domain-containing protein [Planctomycetes bacterium]|nr:SIMPL domain-containing protein [Planctomycetota bacterium]